MTKQELKEYHKKLYQANKEIILLKHKIYREAHKEHIKVYNKQYREEHKQEYNLRKKIDLDFKLRCYLRSRISNALRYNTKSAHTEELLGCSLDFLKLHLERQFKIGMTWANYGNGWYGKGLEQWHIDHIIPCISFDLSKSEEQKLCFNYTNLQPLWAEENRKKHNKI